MGAQSEDKPAESASTDAGKIKVQIRTNRVQKVFTVQEDISIKDLRAEAAKSFDVDDPALTVLIFGGRILKDNEDIKSHGVKDGQTIHLVIRNASQGNNSSATNTGSSQPGNQQLQSATNTSTNANDTNIPSNNPRDPSANPTRGSVGDLQQGLQQMLISSPEAVQGWLQQLAENPDMIRSLSGSVQRLQSIMESNPEVNHLLSNPELLRESIEMVRNPAALQEVMRNYDRALNNMESTPGGYNVLRRMYTEFQEPLLSAFQEQFNTNQFGSGQSQGSGNESGATANESEQQRTENRDPLPNPWASPTPASRPQFPPSPNLSASAAPGAQGGVNTNDLMRQAGSMLQNQEFMSLISNPEAIQAVEQIQQGFERLQRIAPSLFGRLGIPNLPGSNLNLGRLASRDTNQPSDINSALDPSNSADSMSQLLRQLLGSGLAGAPGVPGAQAANPDQPPSTEAARMLSQLLGAAGQTASGGGAGAGIDLAAAATQGAPGQPPEERYSQQLQQLVDMGFTNREANLRALVATFGDINAAIARLLPQ